MLIRIEPGSGIPITRQIIDQIRTQCVATTLLPGDRLPSVRELARQLAVNQNTILRAYERLTAEGLLELRHGDGTFVANSNGSGEKQLRREKTQLLDEANRLVRRALALGLSPDETRDLLDEALKTAAKTSPTSGGRTHA